MLRPRTVSYDVVSLTYGAASGRLDKATLPAGTPNAGDYVYSYHPTKGTLSSITAPNGVTLTYAYDGFLTAQESLSGPVAGTVAYGYDNHLRVASLAVNGAAVAYGYDDDGLVSQAGDLVLARRADNGLIAGATLGDVGAAYTYNTFAELESQTDTYSGAPLYRATYTRDKLGRVVTKQETIGGTTTSYGYGYTGAGQLETVTIDGAPASSYGYDANGNRTGHNGTVASTDAQDRLTADGTVTYTYSANGERQTRTEAGQTTTYGYDPLGNLVAAQLPSGTALAYTVDGRNRRVAKSVNGVRVQGFLYQDSLEPVAELDGGGAVVSRFVYGSKPHVPDYLVKGGVAYRVVSDALGSVRLVVTGNPAAFCSPA